MQKTSDRQANDEAIEALNAKNTANETVQAEIKLLLVDIEEKIAELESDAATGDTKTEEAGTASLPTAPETLSILKTHLLKSFFPTRTEGTRTRRLR